MQIGGSDQWGNLVAGVGLIRSVEGASVHALATPLITKPDGTKYGKTEGGAIWISPDLMPPYAFYQFWLNVADAEVPNLLRVFSFKSREEIEAAGAGERRAARRPGGPARPGRGAHHAGARRARSPAGRSRPARPCSVRGSSPSSTSAPWPRPSPSCAAHRPRRRRRLAAAGGEPDGGGGHRPVVSAARRAIAEGGAYLNNRKITEVDAVPAAGDLLHGRYLILRRGKRTVGAGRRKSAPSGLGGGYIIRLAPFWRPVRWDDRAAITLAIHPAGARRR